MRKGKMLNSEIMSVISTMGHTDKIVIADAGLPIPDHVERIDLALTEGVPTFMQVLDALMEVYECESYILADEILDNNPAIHDAILSKLHDSTVSYVSHKAFKKKCNDVKAVIRTGECTPFANIILQSGVIF